MSEQQVDDDRFTAEAYEQQREALWDWIKAASSGDPKTLTREQFDADFDADLAEMKREEAAIQSANPD